jgi:hypothetical protein
MDNGGLDALSQLGIKLSTLVSGFAGGMFYYYINGSKQSKINLVQTVLEAVISGMMGGIFAVYMTPLAMWYFSIPNSVEISAGAGFVVGLIGFVAGRGIVRLVEKWAKDPYIPTKGKEQ